MITPHGIFRPIWLICPKLPATVVKCSFFTASWGNKFFIISQLTVSTAHCHFWRVLPSQFDLISPIYSQIQQVFNTNLTTVLKLIITTTNEHFPWNLRTQFSWTQTVDGYILVHTPSTLYLTPETNYLSFSKLVYPKESLEHSLDYKHDGNARQTNKLQKDELYYKPLGKMARRHERCVSEEVQVSQCLLKQNTVCTHLLSRMI